MGTITNQYVANQTHKQDPEPGPEPKHEPEHIPKPRHEPELEPGSESESKLESESESESGSEPEPEPNHRKQTNLNQQHNKRGKKKTKPEPTPEEYIISRLTHINLNDKVEYNRSTIPLPDDKPPTEKKTKAENNVKAKINQLRSKYLRQKAEAKEAKPKVGPNPKPKKNCNPKHAYNQNTDSLNLNIAR